MDISHANKRQLDNIWNVLNASVLILYTILCHSHIMSQALNIDTQLEQTSPLYNMYYYSIRFLTAVFDRTRIHIPVVH